MLNQTTETKRDRASLFDIYLNIKNLQASLY